MAANNTNNLMVDENFRNACRDYFYLVDHEFPERGVLKLVGDRYRLNGDQRTVLYRGISAKKRSEVRKSLLTNDVEGKELVIDGYNVLFTLLNYRLGRILFISTDNYLRDAGSLHGKLRDEKTFRECTDLMLKYLKSKQPVSAAIYLDAPVSHSQKHALMISENMKEAGIQGACYVIRSADWALKQQQTAVIATADTAIIEKALTQVVDIPRDILERTYNATFPELSGLIAPG
ncbi:MAG: DUF434 domain-containing protein [Bacteroidales bacterium]|nr:DUF434 domain-containing protein [Bacteroidales bacterium]